VTKTWVEPMVAVPEDNLAQNDLGAGVVIIVLVLAVVAYGGYCTYSGGSFEANISLKSVSVSCR